MVQEISDKEDSRPPEESDEQKKIMFEELKNRALWFIKLRWFVPPGIAGCTLFAGRLGFTLPRETLFAAAVLILAYNAIFYLKSRRVEEDVERERKYIRDLTWWQFGLDFCSMFLLIHLTGGAASPLIFFFVFHIIFASILLPPRSSYGFASMVVTGMVVITMAGYFGWIPRHFLILNGKALNLIELPVHLLVLLFFFSASVYITAFFTSSIMAMLRKRISNLVALSEEIKHLNQKLNALYTTTQAIGSTRQLDRVLKIVTSELGEVLGVPGISVKLLSEDGRSLHFVAADGLVADVFKGKVVEVEKSPLNKQIIGGEPFVTGHVTRKEMFQFGEGLASANVQSVLFVPLMVEEKVIGILGAYSRHAERFSPGDVDFFRQAAGLVAVAIQNAQAYEAIENLIRERSWFMMRVAHNLRSPLAAVITMLDVTRGGFQGELNPAQGEYLYRVYRRIQTMLSMINELLTLAENREHIRSAPLQPVDLKILAGRMQRAFQEEAEKKEIDFAVLVPDSLPVILGDSSMLDQALENLISNAIKYTPDGGRVRVEFSAGPDRFVKIQISDTGIGIPAEAKKQIFTEFFRAENARAIDENGTGLGLAIVKKAVERHRGRIIVESEEGLGTLFVVHLPVTPNALNSKKQGA